MAESPCQGKYDTTYGLINRCSECRAEVKTYTRRHRYGQNFLAFITHLLLELHISNKKVVDHISALFGIFLDRHEAYRVKSHMAEKYAPTYQGILHQLSKALFFMPVKPRVSSEGDTISGCSQTSPRSHMYILSREKGRFWRTYSMDSAAFWSPVSMPHTTPLRALSRNV